MRCRTQLLSHLEEVVCGDRQGVTVPIFSYEIVNSRKLCNKLPMIYSVMTQQQCHLFMTRLQQPKCSSQERNSYIKELLTSWLLIAQLWHGDTRVFRHPGHQRLQPTEARPIIRGRVCKYMAEIKARHVPLTREMIAYFASAVAQEPVSES